MERVQADSGHRRGFGIIGSGHCCLSRVKAVGSAGLPRKFRHCCDLKHFAPCPVKLMISQIGILIVSLFPEAPVAPILSANLIPTAISLRSAIIQKSSPIEIVAVSANIVYWFMMIIIPYSARMGGVLSGATSHGGGSLGSYGKKLPRHIEEPSCQSESLSSSLLSYSAP